MNLKRLIIANLGILLFLAGVTQVQAQPATTATVNPNQPWQGFMNVFGINTDGTPNYGAYQFGSAWANVDLRAAFSGTNYLTITGCTNVWNPTNTYWVNPDGSPNKWMDANFYVDTTSIAGEYVTFSGVCSSNTLSGNASSVAFVKDFVPNYSSFSGSTASLVPGQPFTVSLQTTAGNHIQFGFETQGPDVNPTHLVNSGSVVITADNSLPSLLPLTSLALVEGQTASFTNTAYGNPTLNYQWAYSSASDPYGFLLTDLTDGGNVSGSTSNILTITNISLANIGYYWVTVTNRLGSATENTSLGVQPFSTQIQTNMLVDPGFESGAFASSPSAGWFGFNGCAFESSYVLDGNYGFQVYSSGPGTYNGVYQDRSATPGTIYTGNAWFFTPSSDSILGAGACYLEVQFRDASDQVVLVDYRTASVTTNSPIDTWINLQPTNIYAGNFTTFLGTSPYMVAPPGSAFVRFQITYAADAGGSIYEDVTDLRLRSPVASASVSGNNVQISFPTIYGPIYDVLYKTKLTDSTWTKLSSVTGDGSVKTVTDAHSAGTRFYDVNTE